MGLRVRLKASFDIRRFPPQSRVVLEALKQYGMILADNGSPWYISGAPDPRWSNDDLHNLGRLTWTAEGRQWTPKGSPMDPEGSQKLAGGRRPPDYCDPSGVESKYVLPAPVVFDHRLISATPSVNCETPSGSNADITQSTSHP